MDQLARRRRHQALALRLPLWRIAPPGPRTLTARARFFASTAALKEHTRDNPFFGTLNAYHWLIYAPMHTLRHVKQMLEVKGTAGYPG